MIVQVNDMHASIYAGSGIQGYLNGDKLEAQFNDPIAILVVNETRMLVLECIGNRIRRIEGDVVSTWAG